MVTRPLARIYAIIQGVSVSVSDSKRINHLRHRPQTALTPSFSSPDKGQFRKVRHISEDDSDEYDPLHDSIATTAGGSSMASFDEAESFAHEPSYTSILNARMRAQTSDQEARLANEVYSHEETTPIVFADNFQEPSSSNSSTFLKSYEHLLPRLSIDPTLLETRRVPRQGLASQASSDVPDLLNRLAEHVLDPMEKLKSSYKNPQPLDNKVILSLERTPKMDPEQVFAEPWQKRYRTVRRLGAGAFGETWLVQSLEDNGLAVMKRVPYEGRYLTWGDQYITLGKNNQNLQLSIDSLRDECAWAYYTQRFGIDFRYVSRFMFMSCLETNLAPRTETAYPSRRPGDHHELYVMLSFAGEPLDKAGAKMSSSLQVANILSELTTALHFMKLAGIVHHDLKQDNIMYRETQSVGGLARSLMPAGTVKLGPFAPPTVQNTLNPVANDHSPTSGHIVIIDFGAMIDASCASQAYMNAAFTPGFVPPEFEIGRRTPVPRTSFDVFSMAGVFSQFLLGENLVHRYVKLKTPGKIETYYTEWERWSKFVSTPGIFEPAVNGVADSVGRGGVLRDLILKFPDFLDNWRDMWGMDGATRERGAENMWQMFLHK